MKKIQNFYLYSYRVVGFIFLTGLIFAILWYGFSMLFFLSNSSWSVPMILSPNQEKVMNHLEHVLVFEHQLSKNKTELKAAEQRLEHKKAMLLMQQQLLQRLDQSLVHQSVQYEKVSRALKKLSEERQVNVNKLIQLRLSINHEEHTIEQELKHGLITKQEALIAHLNLSRLRSSLIDSKSSMYDLKRRAKDYADAASTLQGSGINLTSMGNIIKKTELEGQISQLKSDIFAVKIMVKRLRRSIEKRSYALKIMKNSPYIRATKKATTVAFVPYANLKKVVLGAPIYSCYLDMIFCYKSGHVSAIFDAEEYASHPIFKSEMKGQLIGITFNDVLDAQKKLIFVNSKPLFI